MNKLSYKITIISSLIRKENKQFAAAFSDKQARLYNYFGFKIGTKILDVCGVTLS